MTIRVLVNGAAGRMGRQVVETVQGEEGLELVGQTDIGDDLAERIGEAKAQVVIDFTHPDAAFSNARTIIEAGSHPVVGTTGFKDEEIEQLKAMCAERKLGGVIAPNFAIGAVLMMRFAAEAAKYLPHVEIIELHHDAKAEAPSGTAIKTAQAIEAVRPKAPEPKVAEKELSPGARGTRGYAVPIHSVRLPGHVAHQETILGGLGETLRLRHDSINRECFMPGVMLATKKVVELEQLFYGLEHLL
jgi:4-hydroxy-tetrahydrodipicolinate reductase